VVDDAAMNFSAGWLLSSFLVGSIGVGFFLYGKKQARLPQLAAGILMVIDSSGIISSPLWMCVGASAVLGALWVALRAGL
jgi:hypothetical protein